MRIGMIIQNFHPVIGGAEKQALTLSIALQDAGEHVAVITRRQPGSPCRHVIAGVPVLRLFTFGPGLLNAFFFSISVGLHLLFHAHSYDVIHIHLASSHALVPAVMGRLMNKKIVLKIGGGDQIGEMALSRKSALGRLKLKILAWCRPTVVVVNQGQFEELRLSGLGDLKTARIPNGVDLKRYGAVDAAQKQALRQPLGWSNFVFLFVGRFAHDKLRLDIFDRFVEAWAGVVREVPAATFVMVGEGPLESDYRKIISKHQAGGSIRILPATDNVVSLYQAADVFVLPSITEGLSNALLEAMACGLPVLGSRVAGVVDIVTDGRHGFLFDPFSVPDIAAAIKKMIGQKDALADFKNGARNVAESYAISATAQAYIDLYRRTNTN